MYRFTCNNTSNDIIIFWWCQKIRPTLNLNQPKKSHYTLFLMRYYWPGAARSIESLDRVPLSEKCVHHIRYVILLFSFHHVKINFTTWKIFSRSKNWFHEVRNDFTKCEMISRCQISIHQVILISPSELWLHQVTFHQVNFTKVPRPLFGGIFSPRNLVLFFKILKLIVFKIER